MSEVIQQLEKWRDLTMKQVKSASARALNRTATSTRMEITREIKAPRYGLKAATVKGGIKVRKAAGREDLLEQEATLTVSGRPLPIDRYAAAVKLGIPTARGKRIGATAKDTGARAIVPGGFMMAMGSGFGVFRRKGKDRLPIGRAMGPSIAALFERTAALTRVVAFTRQTFSKNFLRELAYQREKL